MKNLLHYELDNNFIIINLVLSNLPIKNIVECSSINKLFYKVYNNLDIWRNKLIHDFGNENFTIPEQNYKRYKEIYQKYYCIHIQYIKSTKYNCIHKPTHYLKLPKIPSNIKCTTKYYDHNFDTGTMTIQCSIDVKNCTGIKNIKLLLFTKHQITGAAINLIHNIKMFTEGLNISWKNMGIMVMEKMNVIKISEICHEKNGNQKNGYLHLVKKNHIAVVKCIPLEDEKIKSITMNVPNNSSIFPDHEKI